MPALTKDHLIEALASVNEPVSERPFVEVAAVRAAAVCDGVATITIATSLDQAARQRLLPLLDAAVRRHARGVGADLRQLTIQFVDAVGAAPTITSSVPPGVRHVVAVGAGKGGVGKSTIAVNLAVALAREGRAVGLLDGDIYGPSIPTLMGLDSLEVLMHRAMLQPFYVHGVKTMTIGKLVDPEKPLIWRGPMAHGAFKQLADQTEWGDLDYLIIDLPPGTGDVPLTMAQLFSLTGAVVVCTPQRVAQDDAVRAARMFQTLNIPILGVVENMSYFVGDDGKEYDLFGKGGARAMASRLGLPFLGAVPITTDLRVNSDAGRPIANFESSPALAAALEGLAHRVEQEVAIRAMSRTEGGGPKLTVT